MIWIMSGIEVFLLCIIYALYRKKEIGRIVLVLLMPFVLIPYCTVMFAYVCRQDIMQGKMFPKIAPLVMTFIPPDDLYTPLGSCVLQPNREEYILDIKHTYIGKYNIDLLFPYTGISTIPNYEVRLWVGCVVSDGDKEIFKRNPGIGDRFWGNSEYGNFCIGYDVPRDIPIGVTLRYKIIVEGDIAEHINNIGGAKVAISKGYTN